MGRTTLDLPIILVAGLMFAMCFGNSESKVCYWSQRYNNGQLETVLVEGDGDGPCTSYRIGGVKLGGGSGSRPISSMNELAATVEPISAGGTEGTSNIGEQSNDTETCPEDMAPSDCTCLSTCAKPNNCHGNCSLPSNRSCVCQTGYLMEGSKCVPLEDCPCYWSDEASVIPNNQTLVNAYCTATYTCQNQQLVDLRRCSEVVNCLPGRCYCDEDKYTDAVGCTIYKDCYDAFMGGHSTDGIYLISPADWANLPFFVYCKMNVSGSGGWTVLQNRMNEKTDFYREWMSYKNGFGLLHGGFWLGNEKIHFLTKQRDSELRIDVKKGQYMDYEVYSSVYIADESDHYRLIVGEVISGTVTEKPSLLHSNDTPFSTYDMDNDLCDSYNCALEHEGAWWYAGCGSFEQNQHQCRQFGPPGDLPTRCTRSNLNGRFSGGNGQNTFWSVGSEFQCNVNHTEMMIRPSDTSY